MGCSSCSGSGKGKEDVSRKKKAMRWDRGYAWNRLRNLSKFKQWEPSKTQKITD